MLTGLLFVVAALTAANARGQADPTPFDDAFTVTGETVLEGDETVPLTAIINPHITAERIYIADYQSHQIAIYDHDGTRLAETGQLGQGPGDVQMPFEMKPDPDSEQIFVYERGNLRIQVFDAALNHVAMWGRAIQTDHLFPVEHGGRSRMVTIGPNACESSICAVRVYDADGTPLQDMAFVDETPFTATWKGNVAGDTVFVANVHNPGVQSYTLEGEHVVSFPVDSPSTAFLEAESEQYDSREAFMADRRELFSQPYSTIRDLFVHQNYVFVQHQNKNRGDDAPRYFLDVFDREGTLLAHGIETPGVLRSVTDAFYFIEDDEGPDFGRLTIRRATLNAEAWPR
ncbi:hypothetical protein CRI93_06525 [Longimonas halophila]|uniref:6-bladed beta-propeller n=2 Tax=Longimonas halophila TaxID=1469170 RepID=A0A2H3P5W3_9BACT|nr:hypothetical protein CRI93_06525 [Longimonas halophila]